MNEYRGGEHQACDSHEEDALPLEGEGNDDNFVSSAKRTFDSISEGIMSIVNPFSSVASCCSVNPKEKKTAPLMRVQRSTASSGSTPSIQRRPPGHGMSEQLPARMPPPGMSARFSPWRTFTINISSDREVGITQPQTSTGMRRGRACRGDSIPSLITCRCLDTTQQQRLHLHREVIFSTIINSAGTRVPRLITIAWTARRRNPSMWTSYRLTEAEDGITMTSSGNKSMSTSSASASMSMNNSNSNRNRSSQAACSRTAAISPRSGKIQRAGS